MYIDEEGYLVITRDMAYDTGHRGIETKRYSVDTNTGLFKEKI